ncbi:MAG: hypothetical protein HYR76_00960 [Ignavibacteria bacterium]|nr:hypothetical protein [Ignavibacteria bacterium]
MTWFTFNILYMLTHFFLSFAYKEELPELYKKYLGTVDEFTVMFGILMIVSAKIILSGLVCWYVYSRKDFFPR